MRSKGSRVGRQKILKALHQYQSFLISTHVNPDADGLCSELALALYLKSIGKQVRILNEEKFQKMYTFLPYGQLIQKVGAYPVHCQAAIVVDCGDLDRIGKVKDILGEETVIINIDHHVTNDSFGDLNLVKPHASSTAEVIYELFKKDRFKITKDIALLLYLGIMTDTGSFRYDNASANTHAIVSDLLKFKFSVSHWYKTIYENISYKDFERFNLLLRDLKLTHWGRVASLVLRKEIAGAFSKDFDLRDKIFSFIRSIREVELVVIFTEVNQQETRINFRSKQRVNVAALAAHFGGGGHERASGCWLKTNYSAAKIKIFERIGGVFKR